MEVAVHERVRQTQLAQRVEAAAQLGWDLEHVEAPVDGAQAEDLLGARRPRHVDLPQRRRGFVPPRAVEVAEHVPLQLAHHQLASLRLDREHVRHAARVLPREG